MASDNEDQRRPDNEQNPETRSNRGQMRQPVRQRSQPRNLGAEAETTTQNVAVGQVRLDFNLATQLVRDTRLEQLRLLQHLDGHNVLGLLFSSQVDAAKLALA